MDFVIGGLAGMTAGFLTNPFDVVKTRMQLQGELRAQGQHAVHYKNVLHAMYTIAKHDGIAALQKGLVPALWLHLVVNSTRLGIYQKADNYNLLRDKDGNTIFVNSFIAGLISGAAAAILGTPFQVIKTQLMSQASEKIAVGHQHAHKGFFNAVKAIYRKSGVTGLWRGLNGMIIRVSIGTALQFDTFAILKEWMFQQEMLQQSRYLSSFVASNVSAALRTATLTPMDVVMTRLFNQRLDAKGRGKLYSGILDCTYKIAKAEGLLAFYKGFGPSYLRQAPCTALTLVFWDMLKDLQKSFQRRKHET